MSSPTNAAIEGLQVAGMGINDKYLTPYIESYNLTIEKQMGTHDAVQVAYVGDVGKHLDSRGTYNQPSTFIVPGANQYTYSPFPDLGLDGAWLVTSGSSMYNSLQAVYNHQISAGLNVTANYTYGHCMTDEADISERIPYRAQFLAGFGIAGDYTKCDDDAKSVFHSSGAYDLPFGREGISLVGATREPNRWRMEPELHLYLSERPAVYRSQRRRDSAVSTADADIPEISIPGQRPSHWPNASAFATPPAYDGSANDYEGIAPPGPNQMQSRGPSFFNIDRRSQRTSPLKANRPTCNSARRVQPD